MITNREILALLRKGLNESGADSTYTNKFLYSKLKEHAKWLIPREAKSGKLYSGTSIFQTAPCIPIIKVNSTSNCCSINTCCTLFRTRNKIANFWEDAYGPIIRRITSIDGSYSFTYISASDWERKTTNPYNKKNKEQYVFFDNGYFWFPDKAPKKVNITGFFEEDIIGKYACDKVKLPCVKFLDTRFSIPEYLTAELVSKVTQQIAQITKRLPEDADINKNTNRKN
jgi:hypothetical protein